MNKLMIIATGGIIAASLASCGNKEEHKTAEKPKQTVYNSMVLQSHAVTGSVQIPGMLQPYQFVQVYPKVSGFVKVVNVDRGSMVHKGQVLMTLEAPEIEQQVASAKLRYTQAEAAYITSKDRYTRLKETSATPGTVSAFDLQAALSRMQGDSATSQGEYAAYKAQASMYSYLTITAPFDGVITERNIHPGALAGPGSQNAKPMLVLQQLSRLRLVIDIPEQFAALVKDGDEVHYSFNALPGRQFTGTVARSSQSLSSNYRSETLEVDVDNKSDQFKPGMYAEVTLSATGNMNAFVVPAGAVVTTTEKKYVVAADNNAAKLIDVTTGATHGDSVEIYGQIHDGDRLLTNPGYRIKDGDNIAAQ